MSGYAEGLVAHIGINTLLALGAYVMLASGQLSLGNAGFMAIGAYTSAVLAVNAGVPLVAALLIGGIAAGLIGLVAGYPALRLHGIYLAMATLGLGEIIRVFFLNFDYTGGTQGFHGMTGVSMPYIWIWTGTIFILILVLERSQLWLELRAVDDDESAAEPVGLNTTVLKVGAFTAGALITGIAGGLSAQYTFYIEPGNFGFLRSVIIVLYVILGGSTTAWGSLVGAVALTLLPEFLRFLASWRMAVFGLLLVVILIVRHEGLVTRETVRGIGRIASRVKRLATTTLRIEP